MGLMDERNLKLIRNTCVHFASSTRCKAGVDMMTMRTPGQSAWKTPCLNSTVATKTCPYQQMPTEEQVKEQIAQFQLIEEMAQRLAEGKCPVCGGPAEPYTQAGRCRYGPCGHRLGQYGRK